MYCKECGAYIKDQNHRFCEYCGTKIERESVNKIIEQSTNKHENTKELDKKSQVFLILGIILSVCCCMPFGVAVILINELKYKPQLSQNDLISADKTKTLMIVLLIIGFIGGFLISGISFFIELISELLLSI
ncbi:MAG: zinc-ribbon domain-containing protein [Firmicutes bacterium]|nr:zinc-ribbon domain-containing protein [Bacillota bacterium]